MILSKTKQRRKAAAMIEVAIMIPLMVLLVSVAVDLVSGIYRYQQVATLARTGSRYAAVHAGQYADEMSQPIVTADTLKANVLAPMMVGMAAADVTCALDWVPNGVTYPTSDVSNSGQTKQNNVRVTISYPWQPVFLFGGTITLTSRSETMISY